MIIQLPTIVPQERMYQQSSKSCLKHGNMMYSIACHLKAIPVFIPKYSLYFPHSSHGGRPSMILNPFKTWNTPQHIDPHLHNGSLASTSADAVNSPISKSKREGWGALDIGPQSKKVKFNMDEREKNRSATSIFELPSENAAVSRSTCPLQFPLTSSEQSETLVQVNEKSLNKAYDDDGAMDGTHRYGNQLNMESSVSPYPKEEAQGKTVIEDYTQFACHQPIHMSAIKDYSGFLSTETSTHSEKQAMQSSLVKGENSEKIVNLNPASIEEREEGEISSCDSLPGDLDEENDIVEASITNLSNDKTVNLKNHSIGNNKKGEATLLTSQSKNYSSSTINSDTKKWPNDLFESYSDQSPSNQKDSKLGNSSPRDTGDSRYENHQTNSSDTGDNGEKDGFDHSSGDEEDDDDYSEYRYQRRHQHRYRHRNDHDYERDQQIKRQDSRSYYSKDRHSIEEESTSQSDSEEENSMLEKLRKVSHLWRKKERWLSKLPSEEGEVPIENVKKSFFIKEGIDLTSSSSITDLS